MGTQDFTHLKGDTFKPHRFTFTLSGSSIYDFTGAKVKIQLKRSYNDQSRLTFDSVTGGITILNNTSTILDFEIDEQIIDILAFNYIYDIQITMGDVVKTWLGGNFEIIDTVTV